MSDRRGYVFTQAPGEADDLTAPTPPAVQSLASGTTSASATWTHPGAPAGTTYACTVRGSDGSTPTASGSGLGAWTWTVASGVAYAATLTASASGQTSRSDALVNVGEAPALAWAAPASAVVTAGTTSATITWATPTGGTTPYSYSAASVVYDSTGASSTAALSTSGAGAGATTVSGLVNGQTVVVQRTVTDDDDAEFPVQGAATVAATAASVTPGTAPAGQSLAAGTTSVTIGTWGSPSGGTGPYTYTVTELGGSGVTIGGSGLGPWTAVGLTDGVTYAFLLTVTDSLSAKGYSVVTVSVSPSAAMGAWEVVDSLDFTDADWTAASTTSTTASTTAWYLTLYAADGTTPRAYVRNNNTDSRTLSLSPSGSGLTLVNGATTTQPSVAVWPAGWDAIRGGSRRDAWLIEAVVEGEEPSGTTGFVHIFNVTTVSVGPTTPGTGMRCYNSGTGTVLSASCYISSWTAQSVRTVATGVTRLYRASLQVTIADSRRHDIFISEGATDYRDPETGIRVRAQSASTAMTSPGADVTASSTWFDSTIGGRTAFVLYHDGSATSGSAIRLRKLRLLRKPLGSL
jgi:hypothetical protein